MPNGNVEIVGGSIGVNTDEFRPQNMENWHKKIRFQARYGGIHYCCGEAIGQSIVESGAYTPQLTQFIKDIKKTVDPNFLLSPGKFHMYSYEDETMMNYTKNPIE